jgi:hypothetical protein
MKLLLVLPFFLTVLGLLPLGVKASTTCLTSAGSQATASISTTSSSDADAAFKLACAGYLDCGDTSNPYGPIKDWTVGKVTDMSGFTAKCTQQESSKLAAFNPSIENWVSGKTTKQTMFLAVLTHSFLLL